MSGPDYAALAARLRAFDQLDAFTNRNKDND